jgi:hypothetical protein
MRITVELRNAIARRLEEKGSLRKAAKGRDIKWYDIHDVMNRPEDMSRERIIRVYEAFDVQPPTRTRYWRPCLSRRSKQLMDYAQSIRPGMSVDYIFQSAMIALDEKLGLTDEPEEEAEESDLEFVAWGGNL